MTNEERSNMSDKRVRLTGRMPKELEELIRQEAARRGISKNQTMINILNRYFMNQNQ